jgi:hypothetical protein
MRHEISTSLSGANSYSAGKSGKIINNSGKFCIISYNYWGNFLGGEQQGTSPPKLWEICLVFSSVKYIRGYCYKCFCDSAEAEMRREDSSYKSCLVFLPMGKKSKYPLVSVAYLTKSSSFLAAQVQRNSIG